MPGFDEKSGGLILDEKFLQKIDKKNKIDRFSIINKYIESFDKNATFGILFSYESDYCNLIKYLAEKDSKTILAVMGEKSVYSINYALKKLNLIPINNCIKYKNLTIKYIDYHTGKEKDSEMFIDSSDNIDAIIKSYSHTCELVNNNLPFYGSNLKINNIKSPYYKRNLILYAEQQKAVDATKKYIENNIVKPYIL